MNTNPGLLSPEFRAMSARVGKDPLQVQGPGGNTSIKDGDVMWVKASGTELADAETKDIFVAVDRKAALAEAREEMGDGSCKATVIDPNITIRPSIETTFHAALDHPVVVHTHSVATIVHAISPQGCEELAQKLQGLQFVVVPYAKPGLPLTREILARVTPSMQVIILQNHGLICCGATVEGVSTLIADVENRLNMPTSALPLTTPLAAAPKGFNWTDEGWIAQHEISQQLAVAGSYYPDHVVFLGPALPLNDHAGQPPAILVEGTGIALRAGATPSQKAMLRCLSDVLSRVPQGWSLNDIGNTAEAELLNWDAEKYRQALAARK